MVAERRDEERDPLSPELVLVSNAEDARRERERLPVGPGVEPSVVRRPPPPPSYPQITVADEPR